MWVCFFTALFCFFLGSDVPAPSAAQEAATWRDAVMGIMVKTPYFSGLYGGYSGPTLKATRLYIVCVGPSLDPETQPPPQAPSQAQPQALPRPGRLLICVGPQRRTTNPLSRLYTCIHDVLYIIRMAQSSCRFDPFKGATELHPDTSTSTCVLS